MEKHAPELVDHKNGQVLADHDILGEKAGISHEEAAHIGELTAEEKARSHLATTYKPIDKKETLR